MAVAAVVCLLTSWTTLKLLRRSLGKSDGEQAAWSVAAAVAAGCGVWATHFVAMLAFDPGLAIGYDFDLTAVSILIAILGAEVAFAVALGHERVRSWLAGCGLGLDIAAMHYTGMQAVQVSALVRWDPELLAVSVASGVVLGGLALQTALGGPGLRRLLGGTLLLTASICAVHFIGMGALRLEPSEWMPAATNLLPAWWLAMSVAAATAVVLAAAVAGLMFDTHLNRRAAREGTRLRTLADATFEGILIHAEGIIQDVNESLLGLLGRDRESLIGRPVNELIAPHRPAAGDLEAIGSAEALETEFVRADGKTVPVEVLGRAIEYQARPARVMAIRDITERRQSEERIHRLAYHDVLTDLPNRRLFREHLQLALARGRRGGSLAVLYLDLDRFKHVNDTLGHPFGDALLRAVTARLQGCVRASDVVGRLGGDEFAILQENAAQPENATALSRRLVESIAEPFEIDGHRVIIGVSVGIALAEDAGADADELIKCADLALYRAKADGRGTYRFYEAEMDARMQARHRLELDLRTALASGQFRVVYQPLVKVETHAVCGFEALLRWEHPERGLVSPVQFIPLAEEIGLIDDIGEWILRRACWDAARWPGQVGVAVNLSPVQFRSGDLVDRVQKALADAGLPASRLELEVTESLLLGDEPAVLATLHALRRLGIRIAMDDFGTGYSSLSYLRRFPFDKLKIDQSFVRGIADSGDCSAIIRAVADLGRSLGMTVNAEGVETESELAALRAESLDEVQGYLFSEPIPDAEVAPLIERYGVAQKQGLLAS